MNATPSRASSCGLIREREEEIMGGIAEFKLGEIIYKGSMTNSHVTQPQENAPGDVYDRYVM